MAKKSNKTNFEAQILNVEQSAFDFIKQSVKKGVKVRLYTDKDAKKDANENANILYNLPNVTRVGKYSEFDEFAVVGLKHKKGEVVVELEGKGEESGTSKEVLLSELGNSNYGIDGYNLCKLADELSTRLK